MRTKPSTNKPKLVNPLQALLPAKEYPVMETILLVVLVLLVIGLLPSWPYSRGWGYYPSGALTALLIIILLVVLL